MFRRLIKAIGYDDYESVADEISQRNHDSLKYLIVASMPIGVLNIFVRECIVMGGGLDSVVVTSLHLLTILILMLVIPAKGKHGTVLIYLCESAPLLMSLLYNTVNDPNHIAVTFLLLLVMLPPFIVDRPWRVFLHTTFWTVAFEVTSFMVKPAPIFRVDFLNGIEFYVASLVITALALADRFESMHNLREIKWASTHDVVTDAKNVLGLKGDAPGLVGHELLLLFFDIDDFKFFNDMYGHGVGDDIIVAFSRILVSRFGRDHVYRYKSDQFLVACRDTKLETNLVLARACQHDLRDIVVKERHLRPSASCGYVFGTPTDVAELQEMVRHADIRTYEARRNGRGQISGGEFDSSDARSEDIMCELGMNLQPRLLDSLTGLPGMQFFRTQAHDMLESTVDSTRKPVIIYFNITNLKSYNERYGFERGDKLIKYVAQQLSQVFDDRLVSRFNADHFVVLAYLDEAQKKVDAIYERVYAFHHLKGTALNAGVYVYQDGDDVGVACDRAKMACDSITGDYHRYLCLYDSGFEERGKRAQYIVNHIDEALQNERIKVYLQPIMDLHVGKLVSFEVLARWEDPRYGMLHPSEFVEALEGMSLITKLDLYMLRKACESYGMLSMLGVRSVSVNLSRVDFMLGDIVAQVEEVLSSCETPRSFIDIEVTERALSDKPDEIIGKIERLRSLGYRVWLDDFGSEYSSLNMLQSTHFDVIKIDMNFLRTLDKNPDSALIISSIADLSKKLGAAALIEGVETMGQLDFVGKAGCDLVQGYYFSEPRPADEVIRELSERRA